MMHKITTPVQHLTPLEPTRSLDLQVLDAIVALKGGDHNGDVHDLIRDLTECADDGNECSGYAQGLMESAVTMLRDICEAIL